MSGSTACQGYPASRGRGESSGNPEGSPPTKAGVVSERDCPGRRPLWELAVVFLRLGTIAFGGPAAHVALMEREFVGRYRWLSREEFLDLVGAASLIPGPSSTEVAIYVGYRRAGIPGLLVGGGCFILPAALMVAALASLYLRVGQLPQASAILYGAKAVVIPIVAQTLVSLGRAAVKTTELLALGLLAIGASALGVNPLLALLGAGALYALRVSIRRPGAPSPSVLMMGAGGIAATSAAVVPVSLTKLFLVFAKIGATVFGSGYVLLAFLRADLVGGTRWLTEAQLLDAVAVGQVTPGPVFTTATFIGYVLAGPWGAAVATLGVFLPSFVLVAASGPLIPRLRRSPRAAAFLDGVNVAAVSVILVVGVQLARTALVDVTTTLLAVVGFAALVRWRVNSAWLVAAGALAGLVHVWLGF